MATLPTARPRRHRSDEAKRAIKKMNKKLDELHDKTLIFLGVLIGLVVTLFLGFKMVTTKVEIEAVTLKNAVDMKIEEEIYALKHFKRDFNARIENKILEIDGKVDEWSQKLYGEGKSHADDSDSSTCVSKVGEDSKEDGNTIGFKLADKVAKIKGLFRVPKKEDVVKVFVVNKDNVVKGFVSTKEDVVKGFESTKEDVMKGFVSTKEDVVKGFVSTKEGLVKGFMSRKENVVKLFKGWRSSSLEKKSDDGKLDEIKGLPTTPMVVVEEDSPNPNRLGKAVIMI